MKIAVMADIHANLEALEAVLKHVKLKKLGGIMVAGDIVGYGASPNEVIKRLQQENAVMVAGDHDRYALTLENLEWFNEHARESLRYTSKVLTEESRATLNAMKETREEIIDGKKIFMVHGSPENPLKEYVFPSCPDIELLSMLNKTKSDILILGHTHAPFIKRIGGRLVINPGSVGQPRDSIPESRYMILDPAYMQASIQKVPYDISLAAKKIISAGMPAHLAERLFQGR